LRISDRQQFRKSIIDILVRSFGRKMRIAQDHGAFACAMA
jgi:hypothetical protein